MNLLRYHLNPEGYLLYRWLRLRWSRRMRPKLPERTTAPIIVSTPQPVQEAPAPRGRCLDCKSAYGMTVVHGAGFQCGATARELMNNTQNVAELERYGRQYIVMPELSDTQRLEILGGLANAKPVYGYDQTANVYRVDPQKAAEVLHERHRQFDRARIEDFNRLISNTPRKR